MLLKRIQIKNFRSIIDLDMPFDDLWTVLVGANEHGKSNLLEAVRVLDGRRGLTLSDIHIDKSGNASNECQITYTLQLLDQEKSEAISLLTALKSEERDPSKLVYELENNETFQLTISYTSSSERPTRAYDSQLIEHDGWAELEPYLQELRKRVFFFDAISDELKSIIPKDEVVGKTDEVTNGLIKLAGLEGKEAQIFEDTPQARAVQKSASEELSKQLNKLWVQGKEDLLRIELRAANDQLIVDIEDQNTYGDVSSRSRGFKFFIAFILKFKSYHSGDIKGYLFLIDELGVLLHPRGQKDLLNYIKELCEHNQLIYTTHSPFMIDRLNAFRVRVVSKTDQDGTKVDLKPYRHNWKALRTSIGLMLSDSFFYADKNLVVEGASDRFYILSIFSYLVTHRRLDADLNIISIIDSGGASEVPSMVRLVSQEEREVCCLLDSDSQGEAARKRISDKIITKDQIFAVSDFKGEAHTLEDLLPKAILAEAVNKYVDELVNEGVCSRPHNKFGPIRVKFDYVRKIEEYSIKQLGLKDPISKLGIARNFELVLETIDPAKIKSDELDVMIKFAVTITKQLNINL